ncbi:MAG: acetylornithine transaminase [Magnetococcales bacterium]|nr:acetylornithine transaminase [Magnetococcales bacterium]
MSADRYRPLMEITHRPPISFVEGSGDWLVDREGNRYLDFVQGWAVNCLGHCPPVVTVALARQSARLVNCSPAYYNEPARELAAALTARSCFDRIFFCNSGAEANEGAIKLARKWGLRHRAGAYGIITFDHGFHGRTLATMSASGKPQWDRLFEPKVPGFIKVAYNNLEAVGRACTTETVAVMLEPVQGEAGVYPADTRFLQGLREFTRERNILLIVDEIQTGMGRCGTLFDHERAGIEPDIMTLGKGMGGGVPLAAMAATEAVACFEPGDQGGTFNGSALMAAAGLAVLEAITAPGFLEGVRSRGARLRQRLEALSAKHHLGEVRGHGLLLALNLQQVNATDLAARALKNHLLINAPRPDTLRFMPALNVAEESIERMVEILDRLLGEAIPTPSH